MGSRTCGTEGYEKAEVTAGGVDTDELSSRTMETGKCPDCFLSAKSSTSPASRRLQLSDGLGLGAAAEEPL